MVSFTCQRKRLVSAHIHCNNISVQCFQTTKRVSGWLAMQLQHVSTCSKVKPITTLATHRHTYLKILFLYMHYQGKFEIISTVERASLFDFEIDSCIFFCWVPLLMHLNLFYIHIWLFFCNVVHNAWWTDKYYFCDDEGSN